MKKNIEQLTSETILEKSFPFNIGGKEYMIRKPTTATLILFSEEISKLPVSEINKEKTLFEGLKDMKHVDIIARALAILVLDYGRTRKGNILKKLVRKFLKKDELQQLTNHFTHNVNVIVIYEAFFELLAMIDVSVFFSLITFLNGANILKPTKTNETTVSGQLSGDL